MGRSANHPLVRQAVEACRSAIGAASQSTATNYPSEDIYSLGLAIVFLCELDPELYGPEIQQLLGILFEWNGVLLRCVSIVLSCAARMTWKGQHPEIEQLPGDYASAVKLSRKEMEPWEARLEPSATLPKYDITIRPRSAATAGI